MLHVDSVLLKLEHDPFIKLKGNDVNNQKKNNNKKTKRHPPGILISKTTALFFIKKNDAQSVHHNKGILACISKTLN